MAGRDECGVAADLENIYPHNKENLRQVSLFEQYKLDNNIYKLKERQLLL